MSLQSRSMGGLLVSLALLALASPARAGTVGVLLERDLPYYESTQKALEKALVKAVPGTRFMVQRPGDTTIARANALERLRAHKAEIIVTLGTTVSRAAVSTKLHVPLVFSLNHPTKLRLPPSAHMVGTSWQIPLQKAFEVLQELKAGGKIAVAHAGGKDARREWKALGKLAPRLGVELVLVDLTSATLEADLQDASGVYVTSNAAAIDALAPLAVITRTKKLPVVATAPGGETKGVLVTLTADPEAVGIAVAEMVGEILQGKNPVGMSSRTVEKLQTVVNLREARILGLTLPAALLDRAKQIDQ